MKTIGLIIVALFALSSCSTNPIETALESNIKNGGSEIAPSYKLINYEITDTITVADKRQMLSEQMPILKKIGEIDSATFLKFRNQEFKEFRAYTPNYEDDIMRGDLKDASPWCTEIRLVTEKADSILANWSTASTSWDAIRTYSFYVFRRSQYFDSENYPESWRVEAMEYIDGYKPIYEELMSLNAAPLDSALYITLLHTYSLYNPTFGKRIQFVDSVAMDFDYNVIGRESKSSLGDLFQQALTE